MNRRLRQLLILISLISLTTVAGCGRWKAESREEQTAYHIDAQLNFGMSEAELKNLFPDAQLWKDEGGARSYIVAFNDICLWCYSHNGFSKSSEDYVRLVSFENDRLMGIEAVELRY